MLIGSWKGRKNLRVRIFWGVKTLQETNNMFRPKYIFEHQVISKMGCPGMQGAVDFTYLRWVWVALPVLGPQGAVKGVPLGPWTASSGGHLG